MWPGNSIPLARSFLPIRDLSNKRALIVWCSESLTANNTVVTTVIVGINPLGVAITPNGNFAYVTNFSSDNVSVNNTANNTLVATVSVGTEPEGVAITPNGAFAYVTNGSSHNVSVINTANNTVAATVTVGTNPLGVAITPSSKCREDDGEGDEPDVKGGDAHFSKHHRPCGCREHDGEGNEPGELGSLKCSLSFSALPHVP